MTRDTFGNVIFTMAAVLFFTICLYLLRGATNDGTGHAALAGALLVTGAVVVGFRFLLIALRRWGAKH